MRTLLRSLFLADKGDDRQQFLANHQKFLASGLGFEVPEYNTIWEFIREFVRTHNHSPEVMTLRAHFTHAKADTVINEIENLTAIKSLTKGDFETVLNARADDRRLRIWTETLKEAAQITQTGIKILDGKEEKFLHGPIDSARFVVEKARDVVAPTMGGRLSGEITRDGEAARKEYETVEADPLAGLGQMTFIKQMDVALAGAKRYELWIHAAFTGGMKSTLMLNWAYSQAVIYKNDVLIFSLEMPYSQCRRILYAMHSVHPKFRKIRVALGLQKDVNQDVGLPYSNIRDGNLHLWHPNARQFYLEYVIPDFNGTDVVKHPYWRPNYGKIHIEVADPDKNEFTVSDLRSMAEVLYSKAPYSMIFVDHAGLMSPRRHMKGTTENINEVIRDLKKLALGFNRGLGMAVVALFQISREGYKSALKQKEKTGKAGYNLTHLSYANEAERSGDVVTAGWIDEGLIAESRLQLQCLKARDYKPFDTFIARVEWPCRRILTCFDPVRSSTENAKLGAAVDAAHKAMDEGK
jgi:hypothetical protein